MKNFRNGMLPFSIKRSSGLIVLFITMIFILCGAQNGYALASHDGDDNPNVTKAVDEDSDRVTPQVDLRMPVEGRISSIFGTHRRHHSHQGLDIAAERGTPIWAAAAGKVIYAGWVRGYGNTVLIAHADGRQTRYAHAATLLVEEGEYVTGGQQIATVGSTGRSTGAHLHFEVIREDGSHINPLYILNHELANSGEQHSDENIRAAYQEDAE